MKHPLVLALRTDPLEGLVKLLSRISPDARDVVIVGPMPGGGLSGLVSWVYNAEVMEHWSDDGTYLGQEEDRAPTIVLRRGEQQVRMRWSTAWTDELVTRESLGRAFVRMDSLIQRQFHLPSANFASPVQLGRHLMASSWKRDGIRVPPAPPEVRELLATIGPQGRHECLTLPELETIPGLYAYDMRLAYLWCCKGLPFGEVTGNPRGAHKAEVLWGAADGWAHIGLLPMRRQGWEYPMQGSGWVDRREGELADRNSWCLDSRQCLTWSSEGALDRWADGLQWCLRQSKEEPLVHRMFRRVALNTIGSLHRSVVSRHRACSVSGMDSPPAGIPSLRMSEDGSTYFWTEQTPLSGRALLYCHPEWTTTIWARCRARVAQAALQFPREQVIALRQDALFTSQPHPTWGDDGAVGRFRLKGQVPGPLPAPRTLEELQVLRGMANAN
jgi:hypothetical protein